MVEKRVIAFVFARGGSKGLPRKNVRMLGGKPLLAHAIESARALPCIETVIVSTDDEEISLIAKEYGAEVPFCRPSELASDDAPEWLSWRHAVNWFESNRGQFHYFVSLPPTSPFRLPSDVSRCLEILENDPRTDLVLTGRLASRSPYFNMVKRDTDGFVHLAIEGEHYERRQDAPPLYDLTTIAYVSRPEFIVRANRIFEGNVRLVEIPEHRSLDIDSSYDFDLAQYIVRNVHWNDEDS